MMTYPMRFGAAAALFSLSACQSVHVPEHGLTLSAGAALDSIRTTVSCPTPVACGLSPQFKLVKTNAFGWELGAGYRFNKYFSVQAEGQFAIGGESADIRPYPMGMSASPYADLQVKTFIRPALRADLPLGRFFSVFATYGLQLEDILAHMNRFDTGKITTTYDPAYCTTNSQTGQQTCYPAQTNSYPETADATYHHRDLRGSPTVGFELFGVWPETEATSVHVEYQPELRGRLGSVIFGATWHF